MSREHVGKVLYGALFVVLWPAALAVWAWALDRQGFITWGVPLAPAWGAVIALPGLTIAVSAVGTGSHASIDVVAGLGLAAVAANHDILLHALVRRTEALANSWCAWRVGPLRVISHVGWTASAALVGTIGAAMLTGPGYAPQIGLVGAGGLVGALAVGRLLEGRHFARPFGYFGFLLGGLAVLAALATVVSVSATWRLAAALAAMAPLTQAIGRGRCLVQGCCHGREGRGRMAIRVVHPMSRTASVPHLCGTPVWPTQLISAGSNLVIVAVLLRLWALGAPAAFIGGLYLMLMGLTRFAEEGVRGEPQTPVWHRLSIYQWLSILAFLAGAVVTTISSEPVRLAPQLEPAAVWLALIAALVSALAMSVDWPDTKWPMSRLSAPEMARSDPNR